MNFRKESKLGHQVILAQPTVCVCQAYCKTSRNHKAISVAATARLLPPVFAVVTIAVRRLGRRCRRGCRTFSRLKQRQLVAEIPLGLSRPIPYFASMLHAPLQQFRNILITTSTRKVPVKSLTGRIHHKVSYHSQHSQSRFQQHIPTLGSVCKITPKIQ